MLSTKTTLDPTRRLVSIPNGDLLYVDGKRGSERPDTIGQPQEATKDPVSAHVDLVNDEQRPDMDCPWCGQKSKNEAEFRDHVVSQHAAVIGRMSQEQREANQQAATRIAGLTPAAARGHR